jgi:hypothetical protein
MNSDCDSNSFSVGYPTDSSLFLSLMFRPSVFRSILMCVQKAVTSADPRSGQRKERLISSQCCQRPTLLRLSNKYNGGKSRGGHGGDASQIGMGQKTEFSGLGLLRMRMGVQPRWAGRWRINCRNDAALRTAARQGVHISCLCRAPEGHEESPLTKSPAG